VGVVGVKLEELLKVLMGVRTLADALLLEELEEVLGCDDLNGVLFGLGLDELLVDRALEEVIEADV